MGLTGVITRVSFRARPVSTGLVLVTEHRVPDVTRLMAEMSATDHRFTYSVAWIDTLARGRSMGRSVLGRGEHASPDDLGIGRPVDPWPPVRTARLRVPVDGPPWLISRPTVRAFNEVWYRHAPARARRSLVPLASFFHPLDRIAGWNRLYGRLGMVQYQFAVPDEAGWAVVEALRRFSAADQVSALAVLKRFGPGNPSPLSFPMAGWTLAVDLPATPRLVGLLQGLDRLVLEAGGRVYLAKDSRLDRSSFRRMYPRFEAFRRVREHHDPERVFQSDLSRRLDL